jgi:hypothetical protein
MWINYKDNAGAWRWRHASTSRGTSTSRRRVTRSPARRYAPRIAYRRAIYAPDAAYVYRALRDQQLAARYAVSGQSSAISGARNTDVAVKPYEFKYTPGKSGPKVQIERDGKIMRRGA